jgi:hypothetical protein
MIASDSNVSLARIFNSNNLIFFLLIQFETNELENKKNGMTKTRVFMHWKT